MLNLVSPICAKILGPGRARTQTDSLLWEKREATNEALSGSRFSGAVVARKLAKAGHIVSVEASYWPLLATYVINRGRN